MRIERDQFGAHVFLSRRNLLALLAKLDGAPERSACTILGPGQYERVAVTAEEDEAHYSHPSREEMRGLPGEMHPDTEERLRC